MKTDKEILNWLSKNSSKIEVDESLRMYRVFTIPSQHISGYNLREFMEKSGLSKAYEERRTMALEELKKTILEDMTNLKPQ